MNTLKAFIIAILGGAIAASVTPDLTETTGCEVIQDCLPSEVTK